MITDRENTFAERLTVTATGVVGDVVKIGNRQRIPQLQAYLQVEVPINNATSIQWRFVSSAAADLSTPNVIYDTGAVALATLNATTGYRAVTPPTPAIPQAHNYVGWLATVVGTAPTLGGVTAGITEVAVAETDARPSYYTGR